MTTKKAGTLERLAQQVALALEPLQTTLDPNDVLQLFAMLGLQLPPQVLQPELVSALKAGQAVAGTLPDLVDQLTAHVQNDNEAAIVQTGIQLIAQISKVIAAIEQIGQRLQVQAMNLPLPAEEITNFTRHLVPNLLSYLFIAYLKRVQPAAVGLANLFGILDYLPSPGIEGDPFHPPYIHHQLQLANVSKAFSSPTELFHMLYGWGNQNFDGKELLSRLKTTLRLLGLHAELIEATNALDSSLLAVALNPSSNPPGLLATLRSTLSGQLDLMVPLDALWSAHLKVQDDLLANSQAIFTPHTALILKPPAGTLNGQIAMDLVAQPPDAQPLIILGKTGGSVFQAKSFVLGAGLNLKWDAGSSSANADFVVHLNLNGGKVVIDLSEGDGFITTLLSGAKFAADLDLKLLWSPRTGLLIVGSSAVEIAIPLHTTLGPLDIQRLYLKLGLAPDGSLPTEISGAFTVSLGPLQATIDRIGLNATLSFPEKGGNLGPAHLAFTFKPPTGVGLSVNAGVVQGAGFLSIDPERGEYVGALELVFADFLSLHAIGLITTKMPDGSNGFSLLVIITADFGAGIALGFGFTLLAVGGLLGLNRTMLLQPLMNGVRTGSINDMLFPQNVVANAPRIISDLRTIFPPQQKIFLIGPMAKLGWGEPTLVSLSLGVIIEVPGNIAILGVLKLALPANNAALIVIQVNFVGAIEFDKKRLYFFASLFDSRVLFITIEGEMGVLFGFGEDANFIISVGGFHPHYKPPALPFPSPKRIQVNILNESYARIRCEGYFALTSDSVQFGAHAEMFFGFSALSAQGHVGFDALIQFSPFHFQVSIEASFAVKVFGFGLFSLDIKLTLDGPTPWNARGTASFSILFFTIDVDIHFTWGESRNTLLPPISVLPLLAKELNKRSNWQVVSSRRTSLSSVTLRRLTEQEEEEALILHPLGTLRINQRMIPLHLTLDKIGNQKLKDAKRFTLKVTSPGFTQVGRLQEQFAPAQFLNFKDAAKLSQPGYELMDSGIEIATTGAGLATGTTITRVVRYDLTILDTEERRVSTSHFSQSEALFTHFLGGSSVANCALSAYRANAMQPVTEKATFGPETFAVAFRSNNTAYSPSAAGFTSQTAANDYLKDLLTSQPALTDKLHVLPQFEVVV